MKRVRNRMLRAAACLAVLAAGGAAWAAELPWEWDGRMEFGGERSEWVVDLEGAPERVEVRLEGGGGRFRVDEASWDGAWNGTPLGEFGEGTDGGWEATGLPPDAVTRHLRFRADGGSWVLTGVRVAGGDGAARVAFDREDGFGVAEGAEGVEIRARVVNGGGGGFGSNAWECDDGAGRGEGAVFRVDASSPGWHWARVRAGCDGSGEEVEGTIRWRVGEGVDAPPEPPPSPTEEPEPPSAPTLDRRAAERASVEDYYDACWGADGRLLTGADLKAALCRIVNAGTKTNGYGSGLDTILRTIDACPTNAAMVQCIYLQRGITNFNKEHLWAQSHGIDGKSPAYSDLHHLRASDSAMNAARGNLDFDDCRGVSGAKEKNGNWYTSGAWEPPDAAKGDIARALFYVDVRYEPGSTPVGDLELVEAVGTGTESNVLGRLSTLLEWNELDPPDEFETRRNDLIAGTYQLNRNPFVDHPEWVRAVFDPEHWEGGGKAASVEVSGLEARQRYPWNALVDIDYTLACDPEGTLAEVSVRGVDGETGETVEMRSLSGGGASGPVGAGTHRLTWNLGTDAPELASDAFAVRMLAAPATPQYLVVDLSGGPEAESWPVWTLEGAPPDGWGDAYKTDRLLLRRVEPGTFAMGSPSGELGRATDETRHEVALTEGFWMGVFETTQRQWELATGADPSAWKGAEHPVECIAHAEAVAFLETLAAKTGLAFALPTEAQWEYACRAGTTNALNSGRDLTAGATCPRLARLARYAGNTNDAAGDGSVRHAPAGSYRPNAWGLHDMHGNVAEWCADWYGSYGSAPATDPAGAASGSQRSVRGGGWRSAAQSCRSAGRRARYAPETRNDALGVRAACAAGGMRTQRILFDSIAPQTATGRVELAASASSWDPVVFEVVSGPASLDGNTLVFAGGGTVVVAAVQSGGGDWMPARAEQTVKAAKLPQYLRFATIPDKLTTDVVHLKANNYSREAEVLYEVLSGPGVVDGNVLTFTAAGTVVVEATQPGDEIWEAASDQVSINVNRSPQDIVFGEIGTQDVAGRVEMAATATGGGEVTFSVLAGPGVVEGNVLTFTGTGQVLVGATQAGDDYWAAATVTQRVDVVENALEALYMVVDMTGGPEAEQWPVSFLGSMPGDGWDTLCKTGKLVLRRIEPGRFRMGSPVTERKRGTNETQHTVTLTKGFWMAVFETTKGQWELATGENQGRNQQIYPASCSYNQVRGTDAGSHWPDDNSVDGDSFIGVLRAKTGLAFDLPTEAQWEYACRAGTSGAFNDGSSFFEPKLGICPNLDRLGRYRGNGGGRAPVGEYQPNAWGLYDMHGNEAELCLDLFEQFYPDVPGGAVDPVGPSTGDGIVLRGGNGDSFPQYCRCAYRKGGARHVAHGCRVVCPLDENGGGEVWIPRTK